MKPKKKGIAKFWIIAVVITLAAVVFQRMTGPTNPKRIHFELAGVEYKTRLARSLETPIKPGTVITSADIDQRTELNFSIQNLPGDAMVTVYAKRYRTNDEYTICTTTQKQDGSITAMLPTQPSAGKLAYYVRIQLNDQVVELAKEDPVVVRFKNSVPAWVLIPHVLLMFVAMLLSTLTGLLALAKRDSFFTYAKITAVCLAIGGLILGPIVQKYAFGAYWTGWPLGSDLTDNKTLVAFIFWVVALIVGRKKVRFTWAAIASVILLLVYSIPHSTLGSEFDYEAGEIKTGLVEDTSNS